MVGQRAGSMNIDPSESTTEKHVIESGNAMQRFGSAFSERLEPGDVVLLHGDLGAGKTTLTQGIATGLGVRDAVQSPTFTLVQEHEGKRLKLYHLDLYRLDDPSELESIGYETYLEPLDGVSVIEWPERAGDWLPERFWLIQIDHLGEDRRRLEVRWVSLSSAAGSSQ